ncbi:peripheral plasma membrane CASK isoform X1, putative [Babesia ovis]|uniref:Peripheral plasma membrane CASK isoform X1, putative n=1 Tax=Babesia ovis TaxID=5869 RepID=A0A9W5WTG8_BABOV|nr:peripheral plasma membrane CASK isoform X1, putative [Babesia ovis]
MIYNTRCIFPNIYKITAKCADKSIYKSLLAESTPNFLKQVADSRIQHLSPFDSAAILKKLLETTDRKGVAEIRRNPHYRPVASKIVASLELYRKELLFYFLTKFYELHDTCAIKSVTRILVESEAVKLQNTRQIVELLYYAAHHIPKDIKEQIANPDISQGTKNQQALADEQSSIYCESVSQLQRELVAKAADLKDTALVYKLIITLPKLPKTQYTTTVLKLLLSKGKYFCVAQYGWYYDSKRYSMTGWILN